MQMQFDLLKHRLRRAREVLKERSPAFVDYLVDPDTINPEECMKETMLTSDSCSTALKERRLFMGRIGGDLVLEMDCHNHMRNIFVAKTVTEILGSYLNRLLNDSLSKIDPTLRVTASHLPFARAYEKLFGRPSNYPKGDWELFEGFIRENFPGVALYPIATTHGGRQDIIFSTALAMAMNHQYNTPYLDFILKIPKRQDNILRRNLFILLTSKEMLAQCRLLAIMYLSIIMPMNINGECFI